jgi:hypothetical protein
MSDTKKIVFIDIDGPLLPGRAWLLPNNQTLLKRSKELGLHPYKHPELVLLAQLDPVAVSFFNDWFTDPDVYGVVSSNWVHYASKEKIMQLFTNNKMHIRLHEDWMTPRRLSSSRQQEIWFWLADHDVDKYIVVDDDPSLVIDDLDSMVQLLGAGNLPEHLQKRFNTTDRLLYVDYGNGLTIEHFYKGCGVLGVEPLTNIPHLTYQDKKQYV